MASSVYGATPTRVSNNARATSNRVGTPPFAGGSSLGGTAATAKQYSGQRQSSTFNQAPGTTQAVSATRPATQQQIGASTPYSQLGPGNYVIPNYQNAYGGTAQQTSWYPYSGGTESNRALQQQLSDKAAYQSSMLGPDLQWLMPSGGKPIQARDIPWMDINLQYQNQQLGEADRQAAYEALQKAFYQIGNTEEGQAAIAAAMQQLNELPYGAQQMGVLQGNIQNDAARGYQSALQQAQQDYAQRGLAGSPTGYQSAALQQQARGGMQDQMAALEEKATLANTEAKRAAIQQLYGITSEQEARRQAIMEAISQLYANTERTPIDLSGLLAPMKSEVKYMPVKA